MEQEEADAINKDGEEMMNEIEKYEFFESVFWTVITIILMFGVMKAIIWFAESTLVLIDKFLI